jgi:hypothetical protein
MPVKNATGAVKDDRGRYGADGIRAGDFASRFAQQIEAYDARLSFEVFLDPIFATKHAVQVLEKKSATTGCPPAINSSNWSFDSSGLARVRRMKNQMAIRKRIAMNGPPVM